MKKHIISILKFVIKTISTAIVPTSIWVMVKSTAASNSHPTKKNKKIMKTYENTYIDKQGERERERAKLGMEIEL